MYRISFLILLIVIMMAGCSGESESQDSDLDSFSISLIEEMNQLKIVSIYEFSIEQYDIFLPLRPRIDNHNNYVIIDGRQWTINLLSPESELISKVGGIGQGPGEFGVINDILITPNNDMYVLDLSLSRVSHFRITPTYIEFVSIYTLNQNEIGGHYRSLLYISDKMWAVLATPGFSRRFYLVELDRMLLPTRKHIEIDQHFPDVFFAQNATNNAHWTGSGRYFNYVYFDSLIVYTYDTISEQLSRNELIKQHSDRVATDLNKIYISERFGGGSQFNVPNREQFNPNETNYFLPQLRNATSDSAFFIGNLTYFGGSGTICIFYDLKKGDLSYVIAPPGFSIHHILENKVIGVKVTLGEPNRVIVLEIEY